MSPDVEQWRAEDRHLPDILRDFHDQKNLFKTLHELVAIDEHPYCKDISWIAGHCYVIDCFLWFMARHGYVLRKSTAKLEFDDISETIAEWRKREQAAVARLLGITTLD